MNTRVPPPSNELCPTLEEIKAIMTKSKELAADLHSHGPCRATMILNLAALIVEMKDRKCSPIAAGVMLGQALDPKSWLVLGLFAQSARDEGTL